MKVTYAISLEDYRATQPPFGLRPGHNAGFKGILAVCSLLVLLGIFCVIKGLGISTGSFLIGLAVCAAVLAYFYDQRSVSKTKEKYERGLSAAYQRIHCRDERTLEANETGLMTSCKCGNIKRPWSEFAWFSENNSVFFVGTKTEGQLVPKSAFSSEGEITRFRALFQERLSSNLPITSRPIDFAYSAQDFRDARNLHVIKGGGWRRLTGNLATSGISAYGVYAIWSYVSPHRDPALLCGLISALIGVPLLRGMRPRKKHYLGPQRIYFSEQGLHLQNSGTLARNTWDQFIGYLEDSRIFLLYYSPRTYRIIPRRALASSEGEFRTLLAAKLRPYNARHG